MTSHGVGHGSRNKSPSKLKSTVCQPTGHIARYRVRPEVKHLGMSIVSIYIHLFIYLCICNNLYIYIS